MIQRNVAIEARLIDDLMDLSAISAGKLSVSREPVDLDSLVEHVVEMLGPEIASKELELTVESSGTDVSVSADPVRIQQVLWNVVRNAVKFTPRGGRISVRNEVRGEDFAVVCTDSGIGVEAEALPRIFVAYEQASVDTYQKFGGLGLGLAIAAAIVKSHGGRLEAASDGRDRGATFTLLLPLNALASSDSR